MIRAAPGRAAEGGARERQQRRTRSTGHDRSLHGLDRDACNNAAGGGLWSLAPVRETLRAANAGSPHRIRRSALPTGSKRLHDAALLVLDPTSRQIECALASVSQRNVSTELSRSRCFTYQIKGALPVRETAQVNAANVYGSGAVPARRQAQLSPRLHCPRTNSDKIWPGLASTGCPPPRVSPARPG